MIDVLYILGGLVLLGIGGEAIVKGSISIAKRLKLSTLLISTVIVGFGTSMPELVVSMKAALEGSPDIALGNVVGSNICNTLLVLGAAGVLYPVACQGAAVRRDIVIGVLVAVLLAMLSFAGVVDRMAGTVMVLSLAGYLSYGIWSEKKGSKELSHQEVEEVEHGLIIAIPMALISIVMLMGGANLLVTGATSIAKHFGVSEAVIGLTVVAVGTSLPELATAVMAAYRKHTDVIIGNVLGSNLFNILGILGLTAVAHPIQYQGQIAEQDVWVMLAVMALLAPVAWLRHKVGRAEGFVFLGLYTGYVGWLSASAL